MIEKTVSWIIKVTKANRFEFETALKQFWNHGKWGAKGLVYSILTRHDITEK